MMSSTATIGMVGVLLLTIIGLSQADVCFSQTTEEQQCNTIRGIILDGVNNNQIVFSGVLPSNTKSNICNQLTNIHNSNNQAFLGGTEVTSLECTGALSSPPPQQYTTAAQLDEWTGVHCGTWYHNGGPQAVDNIKFQTPASGSPYAQTVVYSNRGIPCCDPFNEIGQGNVSQ